MGEEGETQSASDRFLRLCLENEKTKQEDAANIVRQEQSACVCVV